MAILPTSSTIHSLFNLYQCSQDQVKNLQALMGFVIELESIVSLEMRTQELALKLFSDFFPCFVKENSSKKETFNSFKEFSIACKNKITIIFVDFLKLNILLIHLTFKIIQFYSKVSFWKKEKVPFREAFPSSNTQIDKDELNRIITNLTKHKAKFLNICSMLNIDIPYNILNWLSNLSDYNDLDESANKHLMNLLQTLDKANLSPQELLKQTVYSTLFPQRNVKKQNPHF
jgi:hypothetical protein